MAYNLGPVKPHVKAAAEAIGPRFGITTIYGWRASDPYPDHPSGLALDFMTSSAATGTALAQFVIDNAAALGVDYIIWNRRSWNSKRKTWVTYTGSNPHTDHVHVTFFATPGTGIQNLGLGGSGTDITQLGLNPFSETLDKLEKFFAFFTDKSTWIRASMFIGGVLFIAIGLVGLSGVTKAAKKVLKP